MSIREQYVFITNKNEDMQCIGIKEGKFAGVVYKYGKVSIGEETKKGNLPFRFEYDILDNNMIPREQFDDDNFFNLLGDILVDIIDRQENLNFGHTDDRENSLN
jgi:hypothetical protein|tara:strand:- start:26 stop:337 length:312 start_codon:yes stop_codon:yes gene_type:complete